MKGPKARTVVALVGLSYCAGALTAHWTWSRMTAAGADEIGGVESTSDVRPAPPPPHKEPAATATIGEDAAVEALQDKNLLMPVDGVDRDDLHQSFAESRNGRAHEAIDILAPRNTPVRAVTDGHIAKLFTSNRGGLTVYQFDSDERYCYYYAHLEQYAEGLTEGARVRRGQIIGYVGTSGNAPPNTPHLHFAIFALGPEKKWWEGSPLDPYPALR
jgi:murein DD-endopeptidase MepM/ murein hydrolase activator NlpD